MWKISTEKANYCQVGMGIVCVYRAIKQTCEQSTTLNRTYYTLLSHLYTPLDTTARWTLSDMKVRKKRKNELGTWDGECEEKIVKKIYSKEWKKNSFTIDSYEEKSKSSKRMLVPSSPFTAMRIPNFPAFTGAQVATIWEIITFLHSI